MVCRQIWQRTTGRWVTVTGKRVAAEFFIGPYYARSMELGWCLLGDEVRPERGMSVFCGRASGPGRADPGRPPRTARTPEDRDSDVRYAGASSAEASSLDHRRLHKPHRYECSEP